ncbi:MAG TPA: prepilin peptidase [Candidatus Saccharimonadales bacterium]|nr:prepilin peptidase [Candidatus Saccharimonadales bacterium]
MIMVIAVLGLLGLILGSFVDALTWRLHEQARIAHHKGEQSARRRHRLSMLKGRSMCETCKHELAPKDLMPVVSWLWLGGKCRYCHAHISWHTPVIELLLGGLFALSYAVWPLPLHDEGLVVFGFWLVFLVGFMALAVYDLRWFLLPDRIVFPLIGLAATQVVVMFTWEHQVSVLWQPVLAAGIIFSLFWVLFQVSRGAWIGGGDVKLALVLGLLAGTPAKVFLLIFLASLAGTLASVPVLLRGRQGLKAHIPFGPHLLLATVVVVLWGTAIIDWYRHFLV